MSRMGTINAWGFGILAAWVFRHQIESVIEYAVVLAFYATVIGCALALAKQQLGIKTKKGGGIWKALEAISVAWIAVKFPSRSRRGTKPRMVSYTPGDPLPRTNKPYNWADDIPY